MKLIDILGNYEGKYIKIGARKGTGFIYCDKCTSKTFEELQQMSDRDLIEMKNIIERKKFALNGSRLTNIERRTAKNVLNETQEKINNYKKILDREIVEIYKTIDCRDMHQPMIDIVAFIIEGSEVGKYWTLHEYQSRFDVCE